GQRPKPERESARVRRQSSGSTFAPGLRKCGPTHSPGGDEQERQPEHKSIAKKRERETSRANVFLMIDRTERKAASADKAGRPAEIAPIRRVPCQVHHVDGRPRVRSTEESQNIRNGGKVITEICGKRPRRLHCQQESAERKSQRRGDLKRRGRSAEQG